MQVAYKIFNMCVASDLERKFINVHNQSQTLIGIIEQYITSNSTAQSSDVLLQCVLNTAKI